MNSRTLTSGLAAVGLLLGLLACKKLKGDDKAPSAEAPPAATEAKPSANDTKPASESTSDDSDDSDETTDTAQLPGVVAVGATAELGGLKVQFAEMKECKYERAAYQDSMAKQNQKLVGMLIYFEGDYAAREVTAASHTWKAYDGEGIMYRATSTHSTDCKPPLKSVRLAKGDKAKGWLAFKVPTSTKKLQVKYTHRLPHELAKESVKQRATFQVLGP